MLTWLFSLVIVSHAVSNTFLVDLENFKNNKLSLQTEQQNLNATQEILFSRRLFWTPKVNLIASQNTTKIENSNESKLSSAGVDLNLNLFRGGSDWNALESAKAQEKAQKLQVLNETLRTEISASDLIFKSIYLAESQRIQEQLLKLKEDALKILRDRYQQGKLAKQEVTKSEVDLIQQKNKLNSARIEVLENKTEIASYFLSEVKTLQWPFNEEIELKKIEETKKPLIEQKYWLSQSQKALWESAKGDHWPSIDLNLQYRDSLAKDQSKSQLLGLVTLTLPIWNQYDISAKIASSYAQYFGALNSLKQTEQEVNQKSLLLKSKINIFRANLLDSLKNVEVSRVLYQEVLVSFRLGRISTNDLFQEQNRLLNSEISLALSQLSFHQSLIETCALSGLKVAECL